MYQPLARNATVALRGATHVIARRSYSYSYSYSALPAGGHRFRAASVWNLLLVEAARSQALDQADHQANRLVQDAFSALDLICRALALSHEDVQASGTFQRGAARILKVTASVWRSLLAIAFGEVQRNRGGCAIKLV